MEFKKEELKIQLAKVQRTMFWNTRKFYYETSRSYQRKWTVKRGEIYFVDFGENIGSEENKPRPCVVLQSDAYNFNSPVFTCAIISTSKLTIPDIQISIIGNYPYKDKYKQDTCLTGTIDLGQIRTVAKERILFKVGKLETEMNDVNSKLFHAFGLSEIIIKKDNIINSLTGKIEYLKNLKNDK